MCLRHYVSKTLYVKDTASKTESSRQAGQTKTSQSKTTIPIKFRKTRHEKQTKNLCLFKSEIILIFKNLKN